MSLSDKRKTEITVDHEVNRFYYEKDVREAVKELKYKMRGYIEEYPYIEDLINEIFGEKLT